MKITGGEARGRIVPSPAGRKVRPTSSKMRQALFNILNTRIDNADFLDVFAGSGLMGIEALSRGAAHLIAVDEDRVLASNIQAVARSMGYDAKVITGDFRRVIPNMGGQEFDIIFADPPYGTDFGSLTVALVEEHQLLNDGGILVVEHSVRNCPECVGPVLKRADYRRYGESAFSFFTRE
jgi:16S rRNA (guanine966-N2)-methyltransferase